MPRIYIYMVRKVYGGKMNKEDRLKKADLLLHETSKLVINHGSKAVKKRYDDIINDYYKINRDDYDKRRTKIHLIIHDINQMIGIEAFEEDEEKEKTKELLKQERQFQKNRLYEFFLTKWLNLWVKNIQAVL